MPFSTAAEFENAYASVRKAFASGKTKDKKWRKRQLQQCYWMLEDNVDRICAAVKADLNKHKMETMVSEIGMTRGAVLEAIKFLDKWTADERPRRTDMVNFLADARVRKEPKGVALVIGAWNFPFNLLLEPMCCAITAGCAVIVKPSDVALATQDLLMEIIPKYMDPEAVRVVSGGPKETGYILEHRFDHIFYTGSHTVGRIVATAAAKHLTPCTLELGGQGPAIVTKKADIELSGKRLAHAKFTNAGQVCINVNHIFVDPSVRDALVASLSKNFDSFLGHSREDDKSNPDYYGKIVNTRQFDRLSELLDATKGTIVYGGHRNRDTLYFQPTVVTGVQPDDPLMADEIFGPILPVLDATLDEALKIIASGEHPLALYPFTNDDAEKKRIVNSTNSGGVCVNDCMLQAVAKDAPFGGVGRSGYGGYHGYWGMREFTHFRTTLDPPLWMESALAARYAPYTAKNTEKMPGVKSVNPGFDRQGNDTRWWGLARLFAGNWWVSLFVLLVGAVGWWKGLTLLRALVEMPVVASVLGRVGLEKLLRKVVKID